MITELDLKQFITECEQNMEENAKLRDIAKDNKDMENAGKYQREGRRWKSRWEYYQTCLSYIRSTDASTIESERNLLMPKISTIEQRVFNDLWSRQQPEKNHLGESVRPKPDLKNPVTKKKYDELAKPYNLPALKKQLRTLQFILQ